MIEFSLDDLFAAPTPIAFDAALPRSEHKALRADKVLEPVRPNVGLQAAYSKRLTAMLAEMDNSLRYWLEAAYKASPPEIAQDGVPDGTNWGASAGRRGNGLVLLHALAQDDKVAGSNSRVEIVHTAKVAATGLPVRVRPAGYLIAQDELSSSALRDAMRKLSRRWLKRFDTMATELAQYFAQSVSYRTDKQLRRILKDGGFSVEFKMSMAQRDVLNATIAENVSLIRSIPRAYLTQVEGIVARSVQTGRDLSQLSIDLQKAFGVTKRRAAVISRDQSNKATAMLTRTRHIELGITENVWVHSRGGKVPRPTHVKAGQDGMKFDVAKGWYDPAARQYVWPGTLVNCRCVGRPVIKALSS